MTRYDRNAEWHLRLVNALADYHELTDELADLDARMDAFVGDEFSAEHDRYMARKTEIERRIVEIKAEAFDLANDGHLDEIEEQLAERRGARAAE